MIFFSDNNNCLLTFFIIVLSTIKCHVLVNGASAKAVLDRPLTGFYPDWVPFRNADDKLFDEPPPKATPKKRLASPMNYRMKAVAEADEENFDKIDNDNDDQYDNADWSDVQRPAAKVPVNHKPEYEKATELPSKTKGRKQEKIVKEESNSEEATSESKEAKRSSLEYDEEDYQYDESPHTESNEKKEKVRRTSGEENDNNTEERSEEKKVENKKPVKTAQEIAEEEEKKARILASVDELKMRHEKEQRKLAKRLGNHDYDDDEEPYTQYKKHIKPTVQIDSSEDSTSDEDYDDDSSDVKDKYKPKPRRYRTRPTTQPSTTKKKTFAFYNNPELYVSEEMSKETTSSMETTTTVTLGPDEQEYEKIVLQPLVDEDENLDAPTLFYPKKEKHIRKIKLRTTTETPTTISVELDTTSTSLETSEIIDMLPKSYDSETANTVVHPVTPQYHVANILPATVRQVSPDVETFTPVVSNKLVKLMHLKQKKKQPQNGAFEKGMGKKEIAEKKEEKGHKSENGYEGLHKKTAAKIGHIDKEKHEGLYKDIDGHKKKHHTEKGFYGEHKHKEAGDKHAKYEESGKHNKGHSTKGSHDIHKKEEYEKKVEFFEEDGDVGEMEKHGGYKEERGHKKGKTYKSGKIHAGEHQHKKGEKKHHEKGSHMKTDKGHADNAGYDVYHTENEKHGEDSSNNYKKQWMHHHGDPAMSGKIIDKRFIRYPISFGYGI